jgi:hypothetical protein
MCIVRYGVLIFGIKCGISFAIVLRSPLLETRPIWFVARSQRASNQHRAGGSMGSESVISLGVPIFWRAPCPCGTLARVHESRCTSSNFHARVVGGGRCPQMVLLFLHQSPRMLPPITSGVNADRKLRTDRQVSARSRPAIRSDPQDIGLSCGDLRSFRLERARDPRSARPSRGDIVECLERVDHGLFKT